MSKPLDLIEVMARAIAERRCARDQHRAEQSGCDILLLVDPYLVDAREDVAAVLAALEKEGHVVVPKEPTDAMTDAGADVPGYEHDIGWIAAGACWAAMLNARPHHGIPHPQAPYTPEPRKKES